MMYFKSTIINILYNIIFHHSLFFPNKVYYCYCNYLWGTFHSTFCLLNLSAKIQWAHRYYLNKSYTTEKIYSSNCCGANLHCVIKVVCRYICYKCKSYVDSVSLNQASGKFSNIECTLARGGRLLLVSFVSRSIPRSDVPQNWREIVSEIAK